MLLALLFLSYAVIAWHRPRLALAMLLALLPTYLLRFSLGGVPMTVLEGFILLLAARTLLGRAASSQLPAASTERATSPFADRMVVLAVAWVVAGTLAAIGSDSGLKAWGIWKAYVVEPILLYFSIRALASDTRGGRKPAAGMTNNQAPMTKKISNLKSQISNFHPSSLTPLHHIVLPLLIGAAGVAAVAVWQHWTGYGIPFPWYDLAVRRVTSVFGYPNAVGLYLVPLIPLAFGFLTVERRGVASVDDGWRSTGQTIAAAVFAAAVALVAIVAMFFTRGAGAMVAVTAALATLPLFALLKRWLARHARGVAIAIVTAWVAACLVLTAVLPFQPERPRTGSNAWQSITFQQWSGSVRLSQYREMWRVLRDHPIRGAGLSGYPQAIQQYKEKRDVETFQYPHNLLLAVWSEMGVAGLLVFLAITATFFARAFARRRPASVVAAMIAVLVFGLVDIPIFKNDLAVLWWTLLALGTVPFARGTLAAYGKNVA